MKVREALALGAKRLTAAGTEGAATDARYLMAHALGLMPDRLTLCLPDDIGAPQRAAFDAMIEARLAHQPVAQIIGYRLFWGRRFRVTRDTLDPRPETEILIETALSAPFQHILDLGTGTGCILLTLLAERPEATGIASDLSSAALCVAQSNAEALGLQDRARFCRSDWFSQIDGQFDLIVSNPPYIAASEMVGLAPDVRDWEPVTALSPGGDGLSPYRDIAAHALEYLTPGGRIGFEIGPTQAHAVSTFLTEAGFQDIRVIPDFDGRDRCVFAVKPARFDIAP